MTKAEVAGIEQLSQREAFAQFAHALEELSDHRFVTETAREKRAEFKTFQDSLQQEAQSSFPQYQVKISSALMGSIGAGMAVPPSEESDGSDFDGIVYCMVLDQPDTVVSTQIARHLDIRLMMQKVKEPLYGNVVLKSFEATLNTVLMLPGGKHEAKVYLSKYGTLCQGLVDLSCIWAPSLEENEDLSSSTNMMRKVFLETLVREFPDEAEKIWELIRQRMKQQLVQYRNLRSDGSPLKRLERVPNIFGAKLRQHFEGVGEVVSDQRVSRATELMFAMQNHFEYPDLKTVCTAFGVVYRK